MAGPQIGQFVRVRTSAEADYYQARVVEYTEEFMFIEVPMHTSETTYEMKAQLSQVVLVEYHGLDGSLIRYNSPILEFVNLPMRAWKLISAGVADVQREQRREFVRVPVDLPVRMVVQMTNGSATYDVYSRDLSGGGMAVLIPRNVILHPGEAVQVKFTVPTGNFPVDTKCFVVRVSERNERGYASVSLRFLGMREVVRQRIIQYTFARQRMIKHK